VSAIGQVKFGCSLKIIYFYEQNFKSRISNIGIGIRYNLPFAQVAASGLQGNNTTSFVESVRGSLWYDGRTNYLGASSRSSVGKGGLAILAYLDLNGNGLRDANEPKVEGLKISINGGRIEHN